MAESDYIEVPIDTLRQVGSDMMAVGDELLEVNSKISELSGEDEVHGSRIAEAVSSFYSKWSKEQSAFFTTIGDMGSLTQRIAEKAEELDGDILKAIDETEPYIRRPSKLPGAMQ